MTSKINLEFKYHCADFKKIREILKEIGAKKEIVKHQKDHFFNLPAEKEKQGARLKLRIEGDHKTLIYYKRSSFQKGQAVPSTVDLFEVKDKSIPKFFEKVFGEQAVVEKKREVWRKGNTVFHLDEVKGVGKIFEVELQKRGKITEKDRNLMDNYQQKLLPFLGKAAKGSNVDLVIREDKILSLIAENRLKGKKKKMTHREVWNAK